MGGISGVMFGVGGHTEIPGIGAWGQVTLSSSHTFDFDLVSFLFIII